MRRVLVIGASGFLGRHLALALLAEGHAVRCVARDVSRVEDLAKAGCEVMRGDIMDPASMLRAMESVEGVYVSIHTLSPQPASAAGQDFMDVETSGLQHIVAACRAHGVRRLIYVTFLGMSPDGASGWVRGRWRAEQFLFASGLDVTVIRPGQIVGVGGRGFDMMVSQARRPIALVMGDGDAKWRNIALEDLIYYLVGVLDEPRAYGQAYDTGCDDILTNNQMLDIASEALGRRRAVKIDLPATLLGPLAPLLERMSRLPRGSIKGILDSLTMDAVGDPMPIRTILPRPPMPYRQAVERVLRRPTALSANAG